MHIPNRNNLLLGLDEILNEEKFQAARKKVIDTALETILKDHSEGKLMWRRHGQNLETFVAVASLKNLNGGEVKTYISLKRRERTGSAHFYSLTISDAEGAVYTSDDYPDLINLYKEITEAP